MDSMEDKNKHKKIRVPNNLKIALALGSGVARGFAHIGAIKRLNEYGIYPDIVTGTSIGALVGGCYLAGKIEELEDWACNLNRMKVFSYLDLKIRSAGLIGGKKIDNLLRDRLGNIDIEELPKPFLCIASDMVTGHEVWLKQGNLVDVMKASFAMPGIFPPVRLHNRNLLDGALVNPVPVAPCLAMGAHLTIAIDLNADMLGKTSNSERDYQTVLGFDMLEEGALPEKNQSFLNRFSITRRLFRRENNSASLFGVMFSSLNIIQDRITRSRLAGDPPDVHIKPKIGHIGLLEFEKSQELIKAGEEAVERKISDIMDAIKILSPVIENWD